MEIVTAGVQIVEDSIELGEDILRTAASISTRIDQSNNRGLYDSYALLLIDGISMYHDAIFDVDPMMLMNESSYSYSYMLQELQSMTAEELESLRKAMLHVLNVNEYIWVTYVNMKTIDNAEHNRFTKNYDKYGNFGWRDEETCNLYIKQIKQLEELFSSGSGGISEMNVQVRKTDISVQ